MNSQNLMSVLSAEAEGTDLGFDNSWYHAQPQMSSNCLLLITQDSNLHINHDKYYL